MQDIRDSISSEFGERGIVNEDHVWALQLSNTGINHMLNSRSREDKGKEIGIEHYEVIAAIPAIARKEALIESCDRI